MIIPLHCEQKITFFSDEDITDLERKLIKQYMERYFDGKIKIICSEHIIEGKNGEYVKLIINPNRTDYILRYLTPLENILFKLRLKFSKRK